MECRESSGYQAVCGFFGGGHGAHVGLVAFTCTQQSCVSSRSVRKGVYARVWS